MKILLSAYACEPNRGSEAGVGWNWALTLAKMGHETWVLTRKNNRTVIEEALKGLAEQEQDRLHFVYFDLPPWLRFWKRGGMSVQLYYFFWQMGIFWIARAITQKFVFDRIHHVTFVSIRFPSFLGLLGVPFSFGPVSGGERTPWALRKHYPLKGKIWDLLRDLFNLWVRFDPLMHLTFAKSETIFATTEETFQLIPRRYQHKAKIKLAIGISPPTLILPHKGGGDFSLPLIHGNIMHGNGVIPFSPQKDEMKSPPPFVGDGRVGAQYPPYEGKPFQILYVGNFLYLKGLHLGLAAFARLLEKTPNARFTLIGSGAEESWLRALAQNLSIVHAVEWRPRMSQAELLTQYPFYDAFLFPSLHDSGGMAILEAMSNGLPVVCLDLGGPGIIVNKACGRVIPSRNNSEEEVTEALANALIQLADDSMLSQALSEGARNRSMAFSWSKVIQDFYPSVRV